MSDASKSSNLMPSTCSNNNTNTNALTNQTNTEQPKTKRQKIEKIKSNTKDFKNESKKSNTTATTAKTTLDTNGLTTVINKRTSTQPNSKESIGDALTESNRCNEESTNQLCSSLSSSAHSISSSPSSLNNSPSSTPSSSRATSLTQLLNVQSNLASNNLPSTSSTINAATPISISNNVNHKKTNQPSTDEVDRIGTLPQTNLARFTTPNVKATTCSSIDAAAVQDMRQFELSLTRQCLCGVSEDSLQKPFQSHYSLDANGQKRIANLSEWPTNKLLQFLSNLQLLFDIYLKQNSKGFICARIMDVCDALIRNDRNLIDEIIVLAGYSNTYVRFLAGRVLASFLVIAKQELDDNWLKKLVDNLFSLERLDCATVQKIHFTLEIIKRVVDWKDIDLHPLEDEIVDTRNSPNITHLPIGTISGNPIESHHHQHHHHAFMHLQAQQPTLENNYFAVHFQATENDASDNERISNEAHEAHILGNDQRPIGNMVTIQEQFEQFRNVLNMPTTSSVENAVSQNFTANNANIEALQLSLPYGTQAQSASIPNVFGHSNTSSAYSDNVLSTHFPINATNVHSAQPSMQALLNGSECNIITLTDSESFDTTSLKCITIKILENKWSALVQNISKIIANHLSLENAENCVLNFLQLWENIISVKTNLSIVETLPFYAQLDNFETLLLNRNLPCIVYKQMLCLFNEALCYGSTLALQDMLPPETCMLAHQIVRHVKDFRILDSLPRRQPENIVGLIGFQHAPIIYDDTRLIVNNNSNTAGQLNQTVDGNDGLTIDMDKTILQKMSLLVLKSIAVTVKEIRSDSSDSSIDSTDYDAFQDMVVIERSIRDVLRKLETFIKSVFNCHPECHFSKILIRLFDDQDDHLIEAMVCTLDVTSGISFRNNAFPELVAMLNPVFTFLEFLEMVSNSSDLLLDLLVSNETCFLLYLLRFLKYIRMNWSMFVQSCHDFGMGRNVLDEAMSVLIRLRLQISRLVSRQLYPYDISPVLRLLESCESLYEGNELG